MRIRAALAASVAAAAAAGTVAVSAPAARAATTSPLQGEVAYVTTGGQLTVANGGSQTSVATGLSAATDGDVVFSPTANTVLYAGTGGIFAADAKGRGRRQVTQGADTHPALTGDGGFVIFHRGSGLSVGTTDGKYLGHEWALGNTTVAGETDDFPTVAPNGTVAYERDLAGAADVWTDNGTSTAALVTDARRPSYSPDGKTLAFLRKDASGVDQAFVVSAADGTTGLKQVSTGTVAATRIAWAADGGSLLVGGADSVTRRIALADGAQLGQANGVNAVAASGAVNHLVRLSGATVIDTAVSQSRYTWANHGVLESRRDQARVAVITRQDEFYDAIPGSSLAVHAGGPLLYTPTASLDGRTLGEVRRILAPGATVYLTGGTSALSPAVATALTTAGYHVVRLGGATIWDTAVSIAKQVSAKPKKVLVVTGMNYLDAISAGATGEPIVLTNGSTMPKQTAAYLNSLTPATSATSTDTHVYGVGGPGDRALLSGYQSGMMPSWPHQVTTWDLVGSTYMDTSLMVADAFFYANTKVAVTTGNNWPDGLAASAMMGHNGSPLLAYNPQQALYPGIASYLGAQATSLSEVDILGGTSAFPAAQQAQLSAPLAGTTQYAVYTGGTLPFTVNAPAAAATAAAPAATPAPAASPQRATPVAPSQVTR